MGGQNRFQQARRPRNGLFFNRAEISILLDIPLASVQNFTAGKTLSIPPSQIAETGEKLFSRADVVLIDISRQLIRSMNQAEVQFTIDSLKGFIPQLSVSDPWGWLLVYDRHEPDEPGNGEEPDQVLLELAYISESDASDLSLFNSAVRRPGFRTLIHLDSILGRLAKRIKAYQEERMFGPEPKMGEKIKAAFAAVNSSGASRTQTFRIAIWNTADSIPAKSPKL